MTTATGARHSLAYIAESTYGTTPATPSFTDVRHTGCTLGMAKTNNESQELRSDRQIAHFRHGVKTVSGGIPFELSYGTFDDLLEALLGGAWSTNVLLAGTTRRSFTFERIFNNLATPEYHRFTGAEINGMSLSMKADGIVTGEFSVMAQDQAIATSAIAGSSYGAASTTEPFDSFSGTINEGGSAIATVTELSLDIQNSLNPLFAIGSDLTQRPGIGKSRVTGVVTAFFQDKSLLEKFINETDSSIDITLSDGTSSLKFDMNTILYTGGQPDVEGEGEITIALPFTALYTSGDSSQIVVTRTP